MSQQRDRLADFRAENARLRERIEDLQEELAEIREKRVNDLEWIGRLDEDVERIDETHATAEALRTEQQTRSQADAKLERKIEVLAEAVDVNLTDSKVMGEDRLTRLLRYGPEDITDDPTKAHHRARCLLSYIADYGTKRDDAYGKRFDVTTSEARECFRDKRDERLSSNQIRRVFEKVVDVAADSPRSVSIGTDPNDVRTLSVQLDDGGQER